MEGINVSIYTLNDPQSSFYIKKLRPKNKANCSKIEIIPTIFSDHNALRLDLNYRRKTIKNSNIWRLNTLLNNQQISEEIKKETTILVSRFYIQYSRLYIFKFKYLTLIR